MRYPYSRPTVNEDDVAAVVSVLQGQYLTQGPALAAFEAALCETFGAEHAVACNSGTAALHMAYASLGVGPDAGIVTSPITFLATANAARMCGAPVVFADVNPETGLLTLDAARRALETAPFPVRALVPIHLGGRACDMAGLRALADEFGCAIVEDACHAPLAAYHDGGRRHIIGACDHSDAVALSFHAIKHVAMGEGGALLTNDGDVAARARLLRNHGMVRKADAWVAPPEPGAPWYYEMHEIGWNYRASELQCALGCSQLSRLADGITDRQRIAAVYDEQLGNLAHLRVPPPSHQPSDHAWHLYAIAIDFATIGRTRGEVMRDLSARGIGTQVHYIPVNRQPYYAAEGRAVLPGADAYYEATLSLPMYVGLQDSDIIEIAAAVRDVIGA